VGRLLLSDGGRQTGRAEVDEAAGVGGRTPGRAVGAAAAAVTAGGEHDILQADVAVGQALLQQVPQTQHHLSEVDLGL